MTLNLVGLKIESLDISVIQSGVVLYDVVIFVDRKELPLAPSLKGSGNYEIDKSYSVKDNVALTSRGEEITSSYSYYTAAVLTNENIVLAPITCKIYGYIINDTDELVLFNDYRSSTTDVGNIEIEFPFKQTNDDGTKLDNQKKINECYFGAMYGVGNLKNRLFVGGDSNVIYHTTSINTSALSDNNSDLTDNDLLYFPALSYQYVGRSNKKVVGFDISYSNKLIVYKEESNFESTIYFIEGEQSEVDDLGVYREVYTIKQGNNGFAPCNHYNIANFNGLALFLGSDRNINRLNNQDNLVGDTRYSTSCSYYISSYLQKMDNDDYKNGRLIKSKDILFTCFDNILFASLYEEYSNSNFEFYPLEIKGVNDILQISEWNFLFATRDGHIYSLKEENGYRDNKKTLIKDCSIENDNEILLTPSDFENTNIGDIYVLSSNVNKICLGFATDFGIGTDVLSPNYIFLKDYVFYIENDNVSYVINQDENGVYKLYNSDTNEELKIDSDSQIKLYIDYHDYELNVSSKDEAQHIILSFNNVVITDYVVSSSDYDLNITKIDYKPVKSFYITKPFNMDTTTYFKNIINFTISNPTYEDSDLKVGVIGNKMTNRESSYLSSVSSQKLGFDLANLYFGAIDFEETNVPVRVYTKYEPMLNQIYTNFILYSEENANSIIDDLEVCYRYGSKII